MVYLSEFTFPDADREFDFRRTLKRTCYDTVYPFHILSRHRLERLEFEPITILYGGNGSGKTTVLNVIGEKLGLKRDTLYNRSNFFEDYTALCRFATKAPIPPGSRVISSTLTRFCRSMHMKPESLTTETVPTTPMGWKLSAVA